MGRVDENPPPDGRAWYERHAVLLLGLGLCLYFLLLAVYR